MYSVTDSFLVFGTAISRTVVDFGSDDDTVGAGEEVLAVKAETELYAAVLLTYEAACDESVKFEFAFLLMGAGLPDALVDEADAVVVVQWGVPIVELPVKLELAAEHVAELGSGTKPEVEDENTDSNVVRGVEVVEELVMEADEI